MRVFGIDPGSNRTGYGCVDSDSRQHHLVLCGAIRAGDAGAFPDRLALIYRELTSIIRDCRPDCVAIESLFHATNVRSALKLGHARGVAMLAAVEAGVSVVEYTPAEIKRAIVGYGRAEKPQVGQMIKLLLRLAAVPSPHDAADALAVAICHLHAGCGGIGSAFLDSARDKKAVPYNRGVSDISDGRRTGLQPGRTPKNWREYKPPNRTPLA